MLESFKYSNGDIAKNMDISVILFYQEQIREEILTMIGLGFPRFSIGIGRLVGSLYLHWNLDLNDEEIMEFRDELGYR